MPRTTWIPLAALVLLACHGPVSSLPPRRGPERAIWVTRFDFRTKADVLKIAADCREAGLNTVLFQVRGNADAYYRSNLEPRGEALGGADPGFDPLSEMLEAGRAHGLRVKAWVNVVPLWRGNVPPSDPGHLYHRKPEWRWYDQHGNAQPLSKEFYVSLNPCLPEVREYIVSVLRDIVARYPVDGLHLDYVRFPNEQPPGEPDRSKLDFPRDAATIAYFRGETGKTPDEDREAWNAWRTARVTDLVRDIRHMLRQTRPAAELSAAVGPVPERALHHFQDARTWLEEGLVDVLYPMNYTRDLKVFGERVANWQSIIRGRQVVMGVSLEPGDIEVAGQELEMALRRFEGFAIFAYSSVFDSANLEIARQDEATRFQRQQRRKALLPVLQGLAEGTP